MYSHSLTASLEINLDAARGIRIALDFGLIKLIHVATTSIREPVVNIPRSGLACIY